MTTTINKLNIINLLIHSTIDATTIARIGNMVKLFSKSSLSTTAGLEIQDAGV